MSNSIHRLVLVCTTKTPFGFTNSFFGDNNVVRSIEALAESSRNPKLRKTLYKQKMKIFYTIIKYLDLKIEKGFFRKGVDASAIATGLVALYDGLTINNLLGVNEPYNKKAWTETVKALISGIS
ncbi:MAG TPA: TetR family transcriptional regulator C-terminal domain-containing protein [Nitrososphaeraceae archaeon]|nr:TetR family transcriptional regulator C-terminal domain-containing protein [Nitrososphaeraceae archaeon]